MVEDFCKRCSFCQAGINKAEFNTHKYLTVKYKLNLSNPNYLMSIKDTVEIIMLTTLRLIFDDEGKCLPEAEIWYVVGVIIVWRLFPHESVLSDYTKCRGNWN